MTRTARRMMWASLAIAVLGIPLIGRAPASAMVWLACWLGLATLHAEAAHSFGRFSRLRTREPHLEPSPISPPLVTAFVGACFAVPTAAAWPAMPHPAAYGIPGALALVVCGVRLRQSQRVAAATARRLVRPGPAEQRVSGVIRSPDTPLQRQTFWFRHGPLPPVAVRRERRRDFVVERGQDVVTVAADALVWTGHLRSLSSPPDDHLGGAVAWDEEAARIGSHVIAVGTLDNETRTLEGRANAPVVAFVSDGNGDPLNDVRIALRARNLRLSATFAAAVLALALSVVR